MVAFHPTKQNKECSNFTPELTGDGSYTFFSPAFGETFHSREGAAQEAQKTYVEMTQLSTLACADEVAILDVCYGLGYNSAAALEAIWQVNPHCRVILRALEIDSAVPKSALEHQLLGAWSQSVQTALTDLAETYQSQTPRLDAQLLMGDARQTIQPLAQVNASGVAYFQADAIFFDPFSPPRCPQLWTLDFFAQVARTLKPKGRLATYSCAAAVRAAMLQAGLSIGATPAAGRKWPGTLASFDGTGLQPLSQQEQEHLQTKAAVPYRDPTLQALPEEIVQQRALAQAQSELESTGQWRRRWL
jgi:tRNA U34 5-methylaminomethyl-2-thiouridine-forming methyltransferase MnmC